MLFFLNSNIFTGCRFLQWSIKDCIRSSNPAANTPGFTATKHWPWMKIKTVQQKNGTKTEIETQLRKYHKGIKWKFLFMVFVKFSATLFRDYLLHVDVVIWQTAFFFFFTQILLSSIGGDWVWTTRSRTTFSYSTSPANQTRPVSLTQTSTINWVFLTRPCRLNGLSNLIDWFRWPIQTDQSGWPDQVDWFSWPIQTN